jgi:Ca2+/Na+ antiporter
VIPGFNIIGEVAGGALMIVTGLLGCLMLFMWIGTDHQACRSNWNVLWALPTNIIIPFVRREKRSRYALVAMLAILAALALHLLHIQALPLRELWPVLAALLLRFGMIYRSATRPLRDEPDPHHHH